MGKVSQEIKRAVDALWRINPPGPENLFSTPEFSNLLEVVRATYPDAGRPVFALGTALRNLGLPCNLPPERRSLSLPPSEAARFLNEGLLARSARRRHLLPLDLADDLPALRFGDATLRRFSAEELRGLLDAARLRRFFPHLEFDAEAFARFHWLLVEETIPLDQPPEARAVPILFTDMRQDFGRIEPHKGRFAPIVENALFFLLLAPWEDWSTMPEVDWCGFRLPWVYIADDDLFVRPQTPPTPESLAWETQALTDAWGEVVEVERPVSLRLDDDAQAGLILWDETRWSAVNRVLGSPLFETPVAHFFVRAFLTEGVDEVLAHLKTIEAALGVRSDYERGLRQKPDRHGRLGGARRVAARVAALLGDRCFAKQYDHLFGVRSAFLHGRAMGEISTAERVLARKLARLVVEGLVREATTSLVVSRDDHLQMLLDRGAALV